MSNILGSETPSSFGPTYVIGDVSTSAVGNLVLRVGILSDDHKSWHPTAHVVLTPEESGYLINRIEEAYGIDKTKRAIRMDEKLESLKRRVNSLEARANGGEP